MRYAPRTGCDLRQLNTAAASCLGGSYLEAVMIEDIAASVHWAAQHGSKNNMPAGRADNPILIAVEQLREAQLLMGHAAARSGRSWNPRP